MVMYTAYVGLCISRPEENQSNLRFVCMCGEVKMESLLEQWFNRYYILSIWQVCRIIYIPTDWRSLVLLKIQVCQVLLSVQAAPEDQWSLFLQICPFLPVLLSLLESLDLPANATLEYK